MNLANSYSTSGYAAATAYNQGAGYGCLNPYTSSTFAAAAAASSGSGATSYDQADALGCYGLAASLTGSADPLSTLKSDSR